MIRAHVRAETLWVGAANGQQAGLGGGVDGDEGGGADADTGVGEQDGGVVRVEGAAPGTGRNPGGPCAGGIAGPVPA